MVDAHALAGLHIVRVARGGRAVAQHNRIVAGDAHVIVDKMVLAHVVAAVERVPSARAVAIRILHARHVKAGAHHEAAVAVKAVRKVSPRRRGVFLAAREACEFTREGRCQSCVVESVRMELQICGVLSRCT